MKRILTGLGITLIGVILILLGLFIFDKVPNGVELTPKEGFLFFCSFMTIIIGFMTTIIGIGAIAQEVI